MPKLSEEHPDDLIIVREQRPVSQDVITILLSVVT